MASLPTTQELASFVDDTLRVLIDPNGTGAYDSSAGSDNAALISILTKVGTQLYAYASDRKAASQGPSASGDDLALIIQNVYFDAIQDATAAKTTVYLQRLAGPLAATSISQGDRFGTQNTGSGDVEFEAVGTVSVLNGQSVVAVPVQCLQLGAVGNVQLVAITQILDQLDDTNWQLYVPSPGDPVLLGAPAADVVGGGQEQETDAQAKARVFVRSAQATPGTKAGVYKGATTVPGIATAVPVEPGDGTGLVFAGDQNFLLPAALQQLVATALEDWRAFGVPVATRGFTVTTVAIAGVIYMQQALSNYDQNALLSNAVAAVLAYFQTGRARPDEYFLDRIRGAIGDANVGTQSVVLALPAGDVKRPADSTYGAVASMNRYVVTAASISLSFAGPQTA